ncbi:hypothetical protein B0T25DRAFT_559671 [Lasiosphaeria hispida]|uniref:Secreted protein n=1 Tax=Lasiosphaeria hispida TaxID=260671 RepID=A0AAJ0H7D9_9PEZI|nr:hypothetical protein B0T25DRAFT_559671 [Lasiosphaeria hispida]
MRWIARALYLFVFSQLDFSVVAAVQLSAQGRKYQATPDLGRQIGCLIRHKTVGRLDGYARDMFYRYCVAAGRSLGQHWIVLLFRPQRQHLCNEGTSWRISGTLSVALTRTKVSVGTVGIFGFGQSSVRRREVSQRVPTGSNLLVCGLLESYTTYQLHIIP